MRKTTGSWLLAATAAAGWIIGTAAPGRAEVRREITPNYITLTAAVVNDTGRVRLDYGCDFGVYNYAGVPVDVYLIALRDPSVSSTAASVDEALASGSVRVFSPGMAGTYAFAGRLGAPTFGGISFPPASSSGSILIDTVSGGIYAGTEAFAAILFYANGRGFVRTDGFPVEVSNTVTPFLYHAAMVPGAIHVGDGYDPYMATWEVTHPEGIRVERKFSLPGEPAGTVVLRGSYWGTYYSSNPVYINGKLLGYIPGQLNGNGWATITARLSPSLFHAGTNSIVFKSSLYKNTGHWDNYMAKDWDIYCN